ncbi:MAG: hypothetical protein R2774_10820 [Saprospiraceae bacterium]
MTANVLKPVFGGVFLGGLMFFAGPFILLILLLKFIFTPFGMGRMMMYNRFGGDPYMYHKMRYAMADKIRSMSDDEYASFKEKMSHNHFSCNKRFQNA